MLSSKGAAVPGLRAYCRSRHVAYGDFIAWASKQENACGILEVARKKERMKSGKRVVGKEVAGSGISCKEVVAQDSVLYPLHIISDASESPLVETAVSLSSMRGVRISFPNGVRLSIRETESSAVYHLIHGNNS